MVFLENKNSGKKGKNQQSKMRLFIMKVNVGDKYETSRFRKTEESF